MSLSTSAISTDGDTKRGVALCVVAPQVCGPQVCGPQVCGLFCVYIDFRTGADHRSMMNQHGQPTTEKSRFSFVFENPGPVSYLKLCMLPGKQGTETWWAELEFKSVPGYTVSLRPA